MMIDITDQKCTWWHLSLPKSFKKSSADVTLSFMYVDNGDLVLGVIIEATSCLKLHFVCVTILQVMPQASNLLFICRHQKLSSSSVPHPLPLAVFIEHVLAIYTKLCPQSPWIIVDSCTESKNCTSVQRLCISLQEVGFTGGMNSL